MDKLRNLELEMLLKVDLVGYGNSMHLISKAWNEHPSTVKDAPGNFVVGPCQAMTVPCFCKDEKQKEDYEWDGHCDFCCGCGWLTKAVKETIAKEEQSG